MLQFKTIPQRLNHKSTNQINKTAKKKLLVRVAAILVKNQERVITRTLHRRMTVNHQILNKIYKNRLRTLYQELRLVKLFAF